MASNLRPRIAILGRFSDSASAVRRHALVSSRRLVEAVWFAGGEPMTLLPATGPEAEDWTTRLQGFDGVLFPGGGDVNPERYGQSERHETVYDVDDVQDAQDISLTRFVVDNDIPFLAICRGMHVLNVALGGTLHQHIEPTHRNHMHDVTLERDWQRFGLSTPSVHSSCYHHQAIDRVAPGLEVVAQSSEGWVEAMVHNSGVAVQWHPEDNYTEDSNQADIFRGLIARSR